MHAIALEERMPASSASSLLGLLSPIDEAVVPRVSRNAPSRRNPAENASGEMDSTAFGQKDRSDENSGRLVRLRSRMGRPRRFKVLQQFEGTVEAAFDDSFTAKICDVTNPSMPDEFVKISIEEISVEDRSLIVPGCVFYWAIGYETREGGQITRVSEIRTRRAPTWSNREVKTIGERAKATLDKLMGSYGEKVK